MLDSDQEILQTALNWLKQGHQITLITVLKTWGSSPRPVGSLMIIRSDGLHAGSVSGGCIEEDLLSRVKQNQLTNNEKNNHPTTLAYGSNNQLAERSGLPCGGRIELLVEQLENRLQLETIINKINKGQLVCRRVCLNTGEVSLHPASATDEFSYHDNTIKKVFGPAWTILLIGAGHLSQYVAQIGLMLNYHIIVCDPREEYQIAWPLKEIELIKIMPDDAVKEISNHQRSIVLTLTHDPKLDDMALLEALTLNCFYVGSLGSKRNNDNRRKRLAELELSPLQIKQLHAPVGLPIGSHTPAEIAVSIMADITANRNLSVNISNDGKSQIAQNNINVA
ncbi:MAG: hypothetical protein DIZ80_01930 [endosymbiont of Galathealinum brachiosum]|uniref:Xanthine dehydrogenase n=1 Tax=endosymbiont of Galathealinum brachiosum TaxID=2200906 RepID=A0A370DLC0_9GAMM|nr:MAG: hypothetical protein DIZ80_01930 [endosymbiont of Galathealinum brachiosum]